MVDAEEYVECNLCKTRAKFKNMTLVQNRKDSTVFNAVCPRCVRGIRHG
jgi:hypothetical protein